MRYSYKEQGDANHWVIFNPQGDWFMFVQFNGEITEHKQKEHLDNLIKSLNEKI